VQWIGYSFDVGMARWGVLKSLDSGGEEGLGNDDNFVAG
jgi:hypothetical protein